MQVIEESPVAIGCLVADEAPAFDRDSRGRDALELMGEDLIGSETPLCSEHLHLDLVWFESAEATEGDLWAARKVCAECPVLQGCDRRARFNPYAPYFLAGTTRGERLASLSRTDRIDFRRRGVALLHELGFGAAEIAALLSDWMGPARCGRRTIEQDIADLGLVRRGRRA